MPNIALVVLDTLRYDSFVEAFDWLEGARYTRAYSTAHWTIPAHASLFTGRYASEVGVHGRSPTLDCPEGTLSEAFRDAGYRTRSLTTNTQLTQYDGWERGFEEFVGPANLGRVDESIFDWEDHVEATEPGVDRYLSGVWRCLTDDCDTLRSLRYGYDLYRKPKWDGGAAAVRKRLAAADFDDDGEFLFVNLMDAHTPYRPPEGESDPVTVVVADAFADGVDDPERVRGAYRASVEYLSEVYRDIYAELEADFDYVVTLSDHGELLGEHGLWNHSIGLHPELIHVPLVVSGDVDPELRHEPVDLLDVHRTVAELGGLDADSGGRDLFGTLEPTEHLFESHGLLPFHEAQFERKSVPESEFHRWQTRLNGFVTPGGAYCYETDPEGGFRVIGDPGFDDPEGRLRKLVDGIAERDVDAAEVSVSEEVRDRLEELGYA